MMMSYLPMKISLTLQSLTMHTPKLKVMISGGGTGGHIFPALAIAEEIQKRQPEAIIHFVGALGRMEMEKVPQAGFPISGIPISGIQRQQVWKNGLFPFKLLKSIWLCHKLIKQFQPDVVIGTGGFASGPLLYVAAKKGIPCLIQEQNSFPGITNKLLAKRVQKICVAYEGLEKWFPASKLVVTGNPVRPQLLGNQTTKEAAISHFGLRANQPVVLVTGGSLGARALNNAVVQHLEILRAMGMQLIWQCGAFYQKDLVAQYEGTPGVWINAFIQDMGLAYQAADVVVSRAGASTISELCVAQKAAVLVPSPNVAEDHQTKNALALVQQGAAILLPETDLEQLPQVLQAATELGKRALLEQNIAQLAKPHATISIVDEIFKLLKS
jgi:UDP-N-acetylglucosamine--N-acetylmuramyl-(pentapeptide) pyrophosphoryl-undecaprenol N-acetylglucosamine transferase